MIIGGTRGCGKTTHLINQSHKTQVRILCANKDRKKIVSEMAKDLNLEIPIPVSVTDLPIYGVHIQKVLVDDIEDVVKQLTRFHVEHATSSHSLKEI